MKKIFNSEAITSLMVAIIMVGIVVAVLGSVIILSGVSAPSGEVTGCPAGQQKNILGQCKPSATATPVTPTGVEGTGSVTIYSYYQNGSTTTVGQAGTMYLLPPTYVDPLTTYQSLRDSTVIKVDGKPAPSTTTSATAGQWTFNGVKGSVGDSFTIYYVQDTTDWTAGTFATAGIDANIILGTITLTGLTTSGVTTPVWLITGDNVVTFYPIADVRWNNSLGENVCGYNRVKIADFNNDEITVNLASNNLSGFARNCQVYMEMNTTKVPNSVEINGVDASWQKSSEMPSTSGVYRAAPAEVSASGDDKDVYILYTDDTYTVTDLYSESSASNGNIPVKVAFDDAAGIGIQYINLTATCQVGTKNSFYSGATNRFVIRMSSGTENDTWIRNCPFVGTGSQTIGTNGALQ